MFIFKITGDLFSKYIYTSFEYLIISPTKCIQVFSIVHERYSYALVTNRALLLWQMCIFRSMNKILEVFFSPPEVGFKFVATQDNASEVHIKKTELLRIYIG